jgi:hypothetical protein
MEVDRKDTVLNTQIFFKQEIPAGSRSVDGVKHAWEEDDVLNLPLRGKGIIVQHFNTDPVKPVRFVAAEPNWVDCTYVDRGCDFEQLEDVPEYRR